MTKSFVLIYGDQQVNYQVQEDPARSTRIAIHVEPDGNVIVDAPPGFSDPAIQKAVQKRARWITKNVAEATGRFAHVRPKEYVSGEEILYLGRRYMLKVIPVEGSSGAVKLRGNRLEVASRSGQSDDIRGRVRAWYRVKARDYFARRLDWLVASLPWVNVTPPFRLLEMAKQWGSCSPTGQIILNPHLIKAPRPCIDYVLVHELAHLAHHNHGPDFFGLLDRHVPDWRKHKVALDDMAELILNGVAASGAWSGNGAGQSSNGASSQ